MGGWNNTKRKTILEDCEKAEKLAKDLMENDCVHQIIQKIAEHNLDRIKTIRKICQIEKYNLYFNGKVGVGKTTAISYLTGLVNKDCLKEHNKIKDIPLLATGSGRTTVCEMEIAPTNTKSRIVLKKMPEEKFEIYINAFCTFILNQEESEKESIITAEIVRFIGNMANFPKNNKQSSKDKKDHKKYIIENLDVDETTITETNLSGLLLEAMKKNIDYKNRNCIEISFMGEGQFEKWLKDTLSAINNGSLPEIPFAEKVTIYINNEDLELHIPEYVASIVDTRGIEDSSGIREDLADSMQKEISISIMCDGIKAFGGNGEMHKLLKHTINSCGKDLYYRIFVLGLENGVELENVNDADGLRNEGMQIKKGEAVKSLMEQGLFVPESQMIFYNALQGLEYTSQGNLMAVNEEEYKQEQQRFWNELEAALINMYQRYDTELSEITLQLKKMSLGEINQTVVGKFDKAKKFVSNSQTHIKEKKSNFLYELDKDIKSRHPGHIRGCVNWYGCYRNFDLYTESSSIGGEEFKQTTKSERAILERQIDELFEGTDEVEKICMTTIKQKMERTYNKYYSQSCDYYKRCAEACLENNEIWGRLYGFWGDGLGNYKERISNNITTELTNQSLENKLSQKNFGMCYMEEIKEFLNIS